MLSKIINYYRKNYNYKSVLKLLFIYGFGISISFCLLILFSNKISYDILTIFHKNVDLTNLKYINNMFKIFFNINTLYPILCIIAIGGFLGQKNNNNYITLFFVWLSLMLSFFLCQTILTLFILVNHI